MDNFWKWIEEHSAEDTTRLRLKYGHERPGEILQIEMRRKHADKFGTLLSDYPHFIFPSSLAAEQSTSSLLARYHASFVKSGETVADLTAGLGIDAISFAEKGAKVVAVEQQNLLAQALRKNTSSTSGFEIIEGDCREIIKIWERDGRSFDMIFIDPARRSAEGGRIFALSDCEPNVIPMLPTLEKITRRLVVKASPMLDITHSFNEIPQANHIVVLGTKTECKELDVICNFDCPPTRRLISAVTLGKDYVSSIEFTRQEEAEASSFYGVPDSQDFIFEPFPAVIKAGAFNILSEQFNLKKIAPNTHLWYGETLINDFPGNSFRILEILPYMSKHIKRYSSRFPKVAVSAKNFDMSSDSLRSKLKVKEGPLRLFAVTANDGNKYLITCEKI